MAWTCPECRRSFGRRGQAHGCTPAVTVDTYFADRPAPLRAAYDAVAAHVATLEGVHVGPTADCIYFKRSRSFGEVVAKRDRLVVAFIVGRVVEDARIVKTLALSAHRTVHYVEVRTAREVTRAVRDWLTEAYASSPV